MPLDQHRAQIAGHSAVVGRAEHRVHALAVRHIDARVDALVRPHERAQAVPREKLNGHVLAPQNAGAASALLDASKIRIRVRVGPRQVPDPALLPPVGLLAANVRPTGYAAYVVQSDVFRIRGQARVQHERLFVHQAGVRQPDEGLVERLEHPVVVLRNALLLEPAVDVDVRLLVVAAVHEHRVRVRQLQRENQKHDLARVVPAVNQVAVEHVHVFGRRHAQFPKQVQQVVLNAKTRVRVFSTEEQYA